MESSAKNLLTTSIIAFAQLGYCENRHFAEAAKDAKIRMQKFMPRLFMDMFVFKIYSNCEDNIK